VGCRSEHVSWPHRTPFVHRALSENQRLGNEVIQLHHRLSSGFHVSIACNRTTHLWSSHTELAKEEVSFRTPLQHLVSWTITRASATASALETAAGLPSSPLSGSSRRQSTLPPSNRTDAQPRDFTNS